jgi:hypothetical protein
MVFAFHRTPARPKAHRGECSGACVFGAKLHGASMAVMKDPVVREKLTNDDAELVDRTPEFLAAQIKTDYVKNAKMRSVLEQKPESTPAAGTIAAPAK